MKKKQVERSGVARCQKCFKYGHYTYECQNQSVYRYRPSRTMQYKQKLKMEIKSTKPPKVSIVNPDYIRRGINNDSSSEQDNQNKPTQKAKPIQDVKLQKQQIQPEAAPHNKKQKEVLQEQDQSSSLSSSSSDSSSDSSSSSDEEQDNGPRKKKTK